jgi:hypothetical protein
VVGEETCSEKNHFTTNQHRLFRCWSKAVTVKSRQITAWVIGRSKPVVLYINWKSSTSGRISMFLITWLSCYFFGKKATTFSNLRPIIGYHNRRSSLLSRSVQLNIRFIPQVGLGNLPSISFPVHDLQIFLSFDSAQSELLTSLKCHKYLQLSCHVR